MFSPTNVFLIGIPTKKRGLPFLKNYQIMFSKILHASLKWLRLGHFIELKWRSILILFGFSSIQYQRDTPQADNNTSRKEWKRGAGDTGENDTWNLLIYLIWNNLVFSSFSSPLFHNRQGFSHGRHFTLERKQVCNNYGKALSCWMHLAMYFYVIIAMWGQQWVTKTDIFSEPRQIFWWLCLLGVLLECLYQISLRDHNIDLHLTNNLDQYCQYQEHNRLSTRFVENASWSRNLSVAKPGQTRKLVTWVVSTILF